MAPPNVAGWFGWIVAAFAQREHGGEKQGDDWLRPRLKATNRESTFALAGGFSGNGRIPCGLGARQPGDELNSWIRRIRRKYAAALSLEDLWRGCPRVASGGPCRGPGPD